MAKIQITRDNKPTPKEFREKLDEMHGLRSPLDDLLEMMRTLALYEHKYKMRSDEFFTKYSRGELGDGKDLVLWAGEYQVFRAYKTKFERQWERIRAA